MNVNNRYYVNSELLRKFKVTLVVRRYAHNSSGTISHDDIVRDIDRHLLP